MQGGPLPPLRTGRQASRGREMWMEAVSPKKTFSALWVHRFADGSSVSDEIDMKGKSFPLRHERTHPCMSFLCIDLLRNESKAFPYSQNMSVNRKGFPAQTKKEEAVNRLWSDPFEFPKALLDLFPAHPF